jgi:hypothetical protein
MFLRNVGLSANYPVRRPDCSMHFQIRTQGYYKLFGRWEISVFKTVTDTNMNTARKTITFLLATFIVTYQPQVSLRSLSKENGVSSAKGLGFDEHDPFLGPLHTRTLLHATSTYGDMWETRHTNLRCHNPFDSFDNEFHRPQPTSVSHSWGVQRIPISHWRLQSACWASLHKLHEFPWCSQVVSCIYVFWDITPCSPLKFDRRFGGTCCLCYAPKAITGYWNPRALKYVLMKWWNTEELSM